MADAGGGVISGRTTDLKLNTKSRRLRVALYLVATLFCVWVVGVAVVFNVMNRPPEQFGQAMKHVPGPVFMLIPFETLWNRARAGHLQAGGAAPAFSLQTVDHQQRVSLEQLRGKPVVLVFGSYT